ncbi:MAG: glutamine synthetase type III [Myxococcales bacterium]|nr:glutamine synthetase type III [Myxococcales bacterium]
MSNVRTSARTMASFGATSARPEFDDAQTRNEAPSESFGSLSLPWQTIAASLDGEASAAFREFVQHGQRLSKELANRVAESVMRWALKHGATHYGHWFHPLTNVPADKHDTFLARGLQASHVPIEQFPGSLLLQTEPDASSFPSGGLRSTHEARGYTLWDPTSAIFIRADGGTRTLCIPAAYVSWKGHALDHKTPLLRSLDALSRSAVAFLNTLSGSESCSGIVATLGTEQEYFVIDKAFLASRSDLLMTGRTLVGAPPPRGQQLEDHYFGPIPARVQAFISDAERELLRLGVPVKTRHCEVAPAQFELAPVFEEANLACDHNVLTMDVLRRVADRHGLACLLHEKPFAGINGSGKHNNWSMATTEGENLLDPGADPEKNLRFLCSLAAVLHAVDSKNEIVRASIASAGNDHRLGANEAPPAIISVYLGGALEGIVEAVASGKIADVKKLAGVDITARLHMKRELTDRNRTTPFAFTGNKFEFRAVGSSENCAWPMTILNAAVADAFQDLKGRLSDKLKKGARGEAALELVREVFNETKRVRFEGNNYAPAWVDEARARGLPVNSNTPAALAPLTVAAKTAFLVEQGVLSREEVQSRFEIYAERYIKIVDIEAASLGEIARTQVMGAVEEQIERTARATNLLKQSGLPGERHSAQLARTAGHLEALHAAVEALESARGGLHHGGAVEGMQAAADHVLPAMAKVREHVDALEAIVSDDLWPLPKYREMLFQGV